MFELKIYKGEELTYTSQFETLKEAMKDMRTNIDSNNEDGFKCLYSVRYIKPKTICKR